jgi:hypothetical protein
LVMVPFFLILFLLRRSEQLRAGPTDPPRSS